METRIVNVVDLVAVIHAHKGERGHGGIRGGGGGEVRDPPSQRFRKSENENKMCIEKAKNGIISQK